MKNIRVFYLKIFSFLEVKFSIYLNRRAFVMIIYLESCRRICGDTNNIIKSNTSTHGHKMKGKTMPSSTSWWRYKKKLFFVLEPGPSMVFYFTFSTLWANLVQMTNWLYKKHILLWVSSVSGLLVLMIFLYILKTSKFRVPITFLLQWPLSY